MLLRKEGGPKQQKKTIPEGFYLIPRAKMFNGYCPKARTRNSPLRNRGDTLLSTPLYFPYTADGWGSLLNGKPLGGWQRYTVPSIQILYLALEYLFSLVPKNRIIIKDKAKGIAKLASLLPSSGSFEV